MQQTKTFDIPAKFIRMSATDIPANTEVFYTTPASKNNINGPVFLEEYNGKLTVRNKNGVRASFELFKNCVFWVRFNESF